MATLDACDFAVAYTMAFEGNTKTWHRIVSCLCCIFRMEIIFRGVNPNMNLLLLVLSLHLISCLVVLVLDEHYTCGCLWPAKLLYELGCLSQVRIYI